MDWLEKLVRPAIGAMKPYSSARNEAGGIKADIFLDANELLWPPYGSTDAQEYNRYGEPQPVALLERLAALYGVSTEQLLVGRGSDEGIELLVRCFCRENQDSILLCPPTFGMYKVAAALQGAAVINVPITAATNYQLDVPAILNTIQPHTKLIFLPTPHAPMGHAMNPQDMLDLCTKLRGRCVIVADEAYVEFSDAPEGMIPHLKAHDNLVVLRTLSKAHALAGERIGTVIAHPALIAMMQKILAAYPLPRSAVAAALAALSPEGLAQSAHYRQVVVKERERLAAAFRQHSEVVKIFPSVGNFLLLEVKNPKIFMKTAADNGILLRNRESDVPNCVRFSVGRCEQNDRLLAAFGLL